MRKRFHIIRATMRTFNYRVVCIDVLDSNEVKKEKKKTARMFGMLRGGKLHEANVSLHDLGIFAKMLLQKNTDSLNEELRSRLVDCALPLILLDIAQNESIDSALNFIGRLCDLNDRDFDNHRALFLMSDNQSVLNLTERELTAQLTKYMLQLEAANADIN